MGTGQKGCTCGGLFVCAESAAFGTSEKPLKGPLKSRSYGAQSSRGVNVSPPWVGTVLGFKPRPGGFLPWFGLVLQVFAPERKETDKQNRPDARLGGGEKPSPIAPHPFLGPAGKDKRHFPFLATGGGSPIAPAFSLTGVWFAPALLLHRGCPRCPAYFLETVVAFSLPAGPHCAAMLHLFICFEKKRGPDYCAWCNIFRGAGVTGPQAWG